MTRFSALTILSSILLAGCASRPTTDDFHRRDEELASIYYTGTKEEADASLRKLLVLIEEAETAGLKAADYDKLRFYIHLQLSRLASAMKNEALARSEVNQAISYFRRAHADPKKTDAELARALTELADAIEKEKPPAWKKEPNQAAQTRQKEIIALGLLEDIQTIGSNRPFGPDVFVPFLGPLSKQAWTEIAIQWEGKSSLMDILRSEKSAQPGGTDNSGAAPRRV